MSYSDQRSFTLADYVDLPGPAGHEADIEGIGLTGGYLWAVGSHSLKRKQIKTKHADAKAIKQLAKVKNEPNRRIIARIPVVTGEDGRTRCGWCGTDPLYVAYHDDEWGRPVTDDTRLFEKLSLEGFQAGLSWITILRKRPRVGNRQDSDADRNELPRWINWHGRRTSGRCC